MPNGCGTPATAHCSPRSVLPRVWPQRLDEPLKWRLIAGAAALLEQDLRCAGCAAVRGTAGSRGPPGPVWRARRVHRLGGCVAVFAVPALRAPVDDPRQAREVLRKGSYERIDVGALVDGLRLQAAVRAREVRRSGEEVSKLVGQARRAEGVAARLQLQALPRQATADLAQWDRVQWRQTRGDGCVRGDQPGGRVTCAERERERWAGGGLGDNGEGVAVTQLHPDALLDAARVDEHAGESTRKHKRRWCVGGVCRLIAGGRRSGERATAEAGRCSVGRRCGGRGLGGKGRVEGDAECGDGGSGADDAVDVRDARVEDGDGGKAALCNLRAVHTGAPQRLGAVLLRQGEVLLCLVGQRTP